MQDEASVMVIWFN